MRASRVVRLLNYGKQTVPDRGSRSDRSRYHAVRHLVFLKVWYFDCRCGSDGQYASPCQISPLRGIWPFFDCAFLGFWGAYLDIWPWLPIPSSHDSWPIHVQKIEVKIEWKQTDGRTDGRAWAKNITFPPNAVSKEQWICRWCWWLHWRGWYLPACSSRPSSDGSTSLAFGLFRLNDATCSIWTTPSSTSSCRCLQWNNVYVS